MGIDQGTIAEIENVVLSENRKAKLLELQKELLELLSLKGEMKILFVCKHNSRRSQFYQVWAQYWMIHFNMKMGIFSGGIEQSGIYPNTLRALRSQGFRILPRLTGYELILTPKHRYPLFSKNHKHSINPKTNFIWVNNCVDQENCCLDVNEKRMFQLPFHDPKNNEELEEDISSYLASSKIVGAEMFWLMKSLHEGISVLDSSMRNEILNHSL